MFRRRLTWFWVLLTGLALAIIGRLAQIQIAQAAQYEELADRILTRPVRYLPAPRGAIQDRQGRTLLSDEPSADICVHYAVLAGHGDYLLQVARALRRRGDYPENRPLREIVAELNGEIERMWQRLAELTGLPRTDLAQRAADVQARVERMRAVVQRKTPTIRRIQAEDQLLPVLEDVDNDVALAVRLELERYPWLAVVPSSRRVAQDADAVAHVLGRLGAASPLQIAADPNMEDELRRLRPGDRCGVSGVEHLGETSLRGWAGRLSEDFDRRVLARTDPQPGRNVRLTLDLDLQQFVLARLDEAVQKCAHPAGAAAVVIDVATREVLALVSYPTYGYDTFNQAYEELRRDNIRMPLFFRAVQAQYPPGSICKAISLVGGLTEEVITAETTFECTGHLLPDKPDRFRCWIYNQYPGATHGLQDAENAVRNSCNIYFFHVGERLGPERLCEWFGRFGLGRTQGTGLIEESPAIVPTEQWLQKTQHRGHQSADAWNFAIGQGELTATPLQAANVAASIAAGCWVPVRLAYDDTGYALGAPPGPPTAFEERHLRVLRRGMWRVVNERGTGKDARIDAQGYELCGKTGSAQTAARVISRRYTLEWSDGRRESVSAPSEEDALAEYTDPKPRVVGWRAEERYPPLLEGENLPAHAWFIGFTQPKSTPRGATPTGRVYALSVIIEFGGSGGHVAGAVAKQIAEYLLEREAR